jgi:hypothetical protein
MANKSRKAGKSTREMAKARRTSVLIIGLVGLGIVIIVGLLLQNNKYLGIGGVGIFILLVLLRVLPDIIDRQIGQKLKEEKRAIRGAKAEEKIGGLLEGLSEDYYVLNDIESPYGNIDHIVIGKNQGVFLIETKSHHGKVEVADDVLLVNGKPPEKDFIAQTLKNVYWLRDEISQVTGTKPWITPVLVFTNAFVIPTKPIKGIVIVNKKFLLNILHRESKPNVTQTRIWELREEIGNKLA